MCRIRAHARVRWKGTTLLLRLDGTGREEHRKVEGEKLEPLLTTLRDLVIWKTPPYDHPALKNPKDNEQNQSDDEDDFSMSSSEVDSEPETPDSVPEEVSSHGPHKYDSCETLQPALQKLLLKPKGSVAV